MATISVQFPGESVTLATRLPPLYFTEASPGSLEVIGSGGVAASGSAPALLYERETMSGGAAVGGRAYIQHDPLDVVGSGGVQLNGSSDDYSAAGGVAVSGSATVSNVNVRHWDEYGLGGIKASGAATDAWNWTTTVATGGVQVSGTATVSALTTLSGTLDTTLPTITALLRQPYMEVTLPKITAALGPEGNIMAVVLPTVSAAVGPEGFSADITATLPSITASTNAVLGTIGVVDATMPALSADVGGGQFSIAVTLPRASCVLSGAVGAAGVVDATLPKIEAYAGATAAVIGQMSAQLPRIRPDITGLSGILGSIDVTLPHLRESLTALRGTTGAINARLEALRSDLDGYSGIEATIDIHMPAVRADATAEAVLAHIKTLCMNLTTAALSEYENYEFTSFCRFNGRYFAAGHDGLFEIEIGDTDAGANINAVFETGDLDFNNEYQKRLSDFYVGYRTDGDLALQITTDESGVVDYTLSNWGEENLHQRRVTLAKGAKGKYWRFAVSNVDGSDFEIDTMNIAVTPMQRRIRG